MAADEYKKAPAFSLPASTGGKITLKDFAGKKAVVLYFYPRDNTPGCTKEACDFRDRTGEIEKLGAVVLGVSPDDVEAHEKFVAKHDLSFPLLADVDRKTCEAYGVWKEKSIYGRKFMGVERSTFLIGRNGRIARAWRKVKVAGHGKAVIEAIKELRKNA